MVQEAQGRRGGTCRSTEEVGEEKGEDGQQGNEEAPAVEHEHAEDEEQARDDQGHVDREKQVCEHLKFYSVIKRDEPCATKVVADPGVEQVAALQIELVAEVPVVAWHEYARKARPRDACIRLEVVEIEES